MRDIAIEVEGLSKRFSVEGPQTGYRTLRDTLAKAATAPLRGLRRLIHPRERAAPVGEPFWALKDVSFEVQRGEVIGIIGRNGAGKSTLLKILSRITEPTEGYAQMRGRVSSLLEVGTGFHTELSGRENIFLNGAILGMKRTEIARKFEEIVAFAEVEKFIDTPVKHYSSGMYLRLAFGVAAHLEPEILVVDEVLAVGDAQFQKRCLGKMQDAARHGRTVLFVSHNMTAVQSLCSRVIWLSEGRLAEDGAADQVVSNYVRAAASSQTEQIWENRTTAPGNDEFCFRRVCVRPENGAPTDPIDVRTPLALEFEYWNLAEGAYLNLSLVVYNEQGVQVFNTFPTREAVWNGRPFPRGLYRSVCRVPGDLLNDGMHRVTALAVKNGRHVFFSLPDALAFDVADAREGTLRWHGKWLGAVRPQLDWHTEQLEGVVPVPPVGSPW